MISNPYTMEWTRELSNILQSIALHTFEAITVFQKLLIQTLPLFLYLDISKMLSHKWLSILLLAKRPPFLMIQGWEFHHWMFSNDFVITSNLVDELVELAKIGISEYVGSKKNTKYKRKMKYPDFVVFLETTEYFLWNIIFHDIIIIGVYIRKNFSEKNCIEYDFSSISRYEILNVIEILLLHSIFLENWTFYQWIMDLL